MEPIKQKRPNKLLFGGNRRQGYCQSCLTGVFVREDIRTYREDYLRTQKEGRYLQARERDLEGNQPCWHFDMFKFCLTID